MKHYRGETKCSKCGSVIYEKIAYTDEPDKDDRILCRHCARLGMYFCWLPDRRYKCEKCGMPSFSNIRENFCSECGGKMVEYEL